MKHIVASWIFCVLAAVALLVWVSRDIVPTAGDGVSGKPLITSRFDLQTADGKRVRSEQFKGRYLLVYFGYTHCPDICPTTLLIMQHAVEKLGAAAKKLQPIFITIDPERDTPEVVAAYVANFGEGVIGLSGTQAEIAAVAENYKIYYNKVTDKESALGYMMDHSGFIYLIGPNGDYLAHFPHTVSERALEEGLRKYVR